MIIWYSWFLGADIGLDIDTAENGFLPDMTVLLSTEVDTQEPLLVTSQHQNMYAAQTGQYFLPKTIVT